MEHESGKTIILIRELAKVLVITTRIVYNKGLDHEQIGFEM